MDKKLDRNFDRNLDKSLIVKAEKLSVWFPVKKGFRFGPPDYVKAVDGVDLEIFKGETLGIVGESGSGKSTMGRALLGLQPITDGAVYVHGRNSKEVSKAEFRAQRRNMQIVFQDPYASLDPRQRIGDCIVEPMLAHRLMEKEECESQAIELLETVGLSVQHYYRRPHEFSGGQRQRIGIARSLALNPEFIVCDEPVSALDVSIQASILNLLIELQTKRNLTYLFISHDLRVVRYIADRVAVMYLGAILEQGDTDRIYENPAHPYTRTLIAAIPEAAYGRQPNRAAIQGDAPNPINPPSGCRMHPRCEFVRDICRTVRPEMKETEPGHFVACHMAAK